MPDRADEANPTSDDAEFLDDLFERAVARLEEDGAASVEDLLGGRRHLRDRAEDLVRRARSVAVIRFPGAPVRVPGYELLRLIGQGGMGAVYLARQERVGGRLVALKILPAGVALSPRARERFRAEANLVAKLRHPNVIGVYDVVDEPGVHAYAMERIEGPSLAELIELVAARRDRPAMDVVRERLDLASAGERTYAVFVSRVGAAIARALGAVHREGLLHRDVKPSNVLLRRDGTPLLGDFGLVRDTESDAATRSGHFAGTPAYAAPEQLRGESSSLDARTDVYALGVTLYHALALALPFRGRSTAEILEQIKAGRALPLRKQDTRLSVDLETIVSKAMDADPARRYRTADDLADDLDRLLSLQPIVARRAGLATRTGRLLRRHRRSVAAAAAGALVASILAIALVGFLVVASRWVEAHVREARLALLDPSQGTGIFASEAWARVFSGRDPTVSIAALDAALDHYASALRFASDSGPLREERDVVAGVRVAAAASAGIEAARSLDGASASDLRSIGLRAFLAGRLDAAIEAWSRLDRIADPDPLVDAALGQIYLVRDEPARAYPRLLRAVEAFPGVGFLVVGLADAALRSGDVAKARRLLDAARGMTRLDPFNGLERVEGDFLAATGDTTGAFALYEMAEPGNSFAGFRRARLLEREGRLEEALARYSSGHGVGEWAEWDRSLIAVAEKWWGSLSDGERFRVVRAELDAVVIDLPGEARSPLRAVAEALDRRRRDPRSPDSSAPPPTDAAPFDRGGPLRALTERMEATTMASWTRWRTYPAFFRNLVAAAWLSPEPAAATAAVDRVCRGWRLSAALVSTMFVAAPDVSAQGTFQALGDLPGGAFNSYGYALSADGTTVVGASVTDAGIEAFRWRAATGMVGLGQLPGAGDRSEAFAVDEHGDTIIGTGKSSNATDPSRPFEAFMWTEASGMQPLGDLPGGRFESQAGAITADGTRTFGSSIASDERGHACEWTVGGDIADLMILPSDTHIRASTSDGRTLVGNVNTFDGLRWTSTGGVQNLGDLPGGEWFCWMFDVSEDGAKVVGESGSGSGREAVFWSDSTGLVGLGDFPGGGFDSRALAIAPDGSLILGGGVSAAGREAAVWDSNLVLTRAADHLASHGVTIPSGWTLEYANDMKIVCGTVFMTGSAFNPLGDREAWLATYPTDAALALRAGNVDTGLGGAPLDVMFVNGSAGDPVERKVTVTAGMPVTLRVKKAAITPNPNKGGYGFWIYDGDLRCREDIRIKKSSDGSIVTLGQANGCMPVGNIVTPGSCPCPLTFPLGKTAGTMSVPKAALLCLEQPPAPKSPTEFPITFPAGTFTILSLHLDMNAPASPAKNIAIGNTIVVVSEP